MTPTLFAYLPREAAVALCKLAEGEVERPPVSKPTSMLHEALGMGIGTLAGQGLGSFANSAYKHITKDPRGIPIKSILYAAPVVGAGLGLAYNMAKAHQLEETQRAVEGSHNQPERRVP
jgi:hypothetical protein